jgi:2-octaprenyl-6-methoxyphenol hydroxylase
MGNAAHTVHPNAAQGLNLGLRDAAVLAECLADTMRQGGDVGAVNTLSRYAALRRCDQRRVLGLSHGLALLFYNELAPVIVARNLAMLAIDLIAPLKRGFVRTAMGLGGYQPRLVRGLPL